MNTLRLGAALLMLTLAGCASKTTESGDDSKQARRERDDYEYVQSGIGSRIPTRVRKGEQADPNAGSSPVAVLGRDDGASMMNGGIRNDGKD